MGLRVPGEENETKRKLRQLDKFVGSKGAPLPDQTPIVSTPASQDIIPPEDKERLRKLDRFVEAIGGIQADKLDRMKERNPFDEVLESRARILNYALSNGKKLPVEKMARVNDIMGRTKLPMEVVLQNFDTLQRQVLLDDTFNFRKFVEDSPVVTKYLIEHPVFADLDPKEMKMLGDVETRLRMLKKSRLLWKWSDSYIDSAADILLKGGQSWSRAISRFPAEMIVKGIGEDREGPLGKAWGLHSKAALKEELQKEEKFIQETDKVGFWEGVDRRSTENPMFILPFIAPVIDAVRAKEIANAVAAVHEGTETQAQRLEVVRFTRLAIAAEKRGHDIFGKMGRILQDMPAFAGEFVATSGVFNAVSKGIFRRTASKAWSFLGASFVQSVAAGPARIVKGAIERMTPGSAVDIGNGQFVVKVQPKTGDGFIAAVAKSVWTQWSEMASEHFGSTGFMKAMDREANQALFRGWLAIRHGKHSNEYAALVKRYGYDRQGEAFKFFIKKHPEVARGYKAGLLEAVGINGILSEFSEERLAALLQGEQVIPEASDAIAELMAFGAPHLPGMGMSLLPGKFKEGKVPGHSEQFLMALHEHVKDSELAKADPETIKDVIREIVKSTGTSTHYEMTFVEWNEVARELGVNARDLYAEIVGDPAGYERASATDTVDVGEVRADGVVASQPGDSVGHPQPVSFVNTAKIRIPVPEYVAHVSVDAQRAKAFAPFTRLESDDMTQGDYNQEMGMNMSRFLEMADFFGKPTAEAMAEEELEQEVADVEEERAKLEETKKGVEPDSQRAHELQREMVDLNRRKVLAEGELAKIKSGIRAPEGMALKDRVKLAERRMKIEEASEDQKKSSGRVKDAIVAGFKRLALHDIPGMKGMTAREAEYYGQVWAARYLQRGMLLERDPFELFLEEGLAMRTQLADHERTPRKKRGGFFGFFGKAEPIEDMKEDEQRRDDIDKGFFQEEETIGFPQDFGLQLLASEAMGEGELLEGLRKLGNDKFIGTGKTIYVTDSMSDLEMGGFIFDLIKTEQEKSVRGSLVDAAWKTVNESIATRLRFYSRKSIGRVMASMPSIIEKHMPAVLEGRKEVGEDAMLFLELISRERVIAGRFYWGEHKPRRFPKEDFITDEGVIVGEAIAIEQVEAKTERLKDGLMSDLELAKFLLDLEETAKSEDIKGLKYPRAVISDARKEVLRQIAPGSARIKKYPEAAVKKLVKLQGRGLLAGFMDLVERHKAGFSQLVGEGGRAGARAHIQFLERQAVIGFFKKANMSSFLHETGHMWLNEISRDYDYIMSLPAQDRSYRQERFIERTKVVLDYLGLENFDHLKDLPDLSKAERSELSNIMGRGLKMDDAVASTNNERLKKWIVARYKHEKWALSTEEYFREGKAPTRGLRKAFRKFGQWLRKLYQDHVIGVTLNKEVKQYMDNLLASEREIAIAEMAEGATLTRGELRDVGFSEDEVEKILNDLEDATDEAIEELYFTLVRSNRDKEDLERGERRRQVEAEERRAIYTRPDVIAYSILISGTMPDGRVPEFEKGYHAGKLSVQKLREDGYSEEQIRKLPPAALAARGGLSLDELTEALNALKSEPKINFESPQQLLDALLAIQKEEIEANSLLDYRKNMQDSVEETEALRNQIRAKLWEIKESHKKANRKANRLQRRVADHYRRQLARAERDSYEQIRDQLKYLQQVGLRAPEGMEEEWEKLPKKYRKPKVGQQADDLATEFFADERATIEQLFDWILHNEAALEESKRRIKEDIPKEAEALAVSERRDLIKEMVRESENKGRLEKELEGINKNLREAKKALQVSGTVQNIIDRAVERRMEQEYLPTTSSEELRQEAASLIYNDKTARGAHLIAKRLLSSSFATYKKLDKKIVGKVRPPAWYRAQAEKELSKMNVRDVNPSEYQKRARQAARRAEYEMSRARQNFQAAFRAKVEQLKYIEMAMAAIRIQEKIDKDIKYAKNLKKLSRWKALGRAGEEFQDAVETLLGMYGFTEMTQRELQERKQLRDFAKEQRKVGEQIILPDDVDARSFVAHYMDVSVEEFFNAMYALKATVTLASRTNQMMGREREELMSELEDKAYDSIEEYAPRARKRRQLEKELKKLKALAEGRVDVGDVVATDTDAQTDAGVAHPAPVRFSTDTGDRDIQAEIEAKEAELSKVTGKMIGVMSGDQSGWINKAKYRLYKLFMMHRTFSSLTRKLDGYNDGGIMQKNLLWPADEAGDNEVELMAEMTEKLHALFPDYGATDRLATKIARAELDGAELTHRDLIAIALNWGNLDNRDGIMGRFERTGHKDLTQDQVEEYIFRSGVLSEKEIDFVQGVWDLYEELWPLVRALSLKVDGVAVEKVDAVPIETKDGKTIRGGYFPIIYDPKFYSEKEKPITEEQMFDDLQGGHIFRGVTKSGHRKNRMEMVDRTDRVMKLDMNVIYTHLPQVIHDLTHYEYLINANRFLRRKKVKKAIYENYGSEFYRELVMSIGAMTRVQQEYSTDLDQMIASVRRRTTLSVLGFKITTAMLQPLGIANTISHVGGDWVIKGIQSLGGKIQVDNDPIRALAQAAGQDMGDAVAISIDKKSKMMRHRGRTMNRDISEVRNRMEYRGRLLKGWEGFAMYMTIRTQKWVDYVTWSAAYQKKLEELGEPKSDKDAKRIEKEAVSSANRAVIDTQGGGKPKDLSRIMRMEGFVSLATMFGTFFNARFNMMVDSFDKHFMYNVDGKDPWSFAADWAIMHMAPVVISSLAFMLLRGGDDEEFLSKTALDIGLSPLDDLMLIREFAGPTKGYRYQGPAGFKIVSDWEDMIHGSHWRGGLGMVGILLHMPTEQLEATMRGGGALLDGETSSIGALFLGPQPGYRRPKR